jgi:hypothetical protein
LVMRFNYSPSTLRHPKSLTSALERGDNRVRSPHRQIVGPAHATFPSNLCRDLLALPQLSIPVSTRKSDQRTLVAFAFFAFAITATFFVGSLFLLQIGWKLGSRFIHRSGVNGLSGLPTIEGAVFALMGLLLAFTVSGALQRFDERRDLIVREATAIDTAYDRLSLIEPEARGLRAKLRDYTGARLELYRLARDFSLLQRAELWSHEQQAHILELKDELWDATVAACPQSNYRPACGLALPALNDVFAIARQRAGTVEKHPPQVVYAMLFALGLGGSLLAGFGMAAGGARSWIHMITFAATLAIVLYVVTDMEFPRYGLIRVDGFDHFITEVYEQLGS